MKLDDETDSMLEFEYGTSLPFFCDVLVLSVRLARSFGAFWGDLLSLALARLIYYSDRNGGSFPLRKDVTAVTTRAASSYRRDGALQLPHIGFFGEGKEQPPPTSTAR